MSLYRAELYKVLTKKVFIIALIGTTLLNFILCFWSSKYEMVDASTYKKLYTTLQSFGSNNDKIKNYLIKEQAKIPEDDYMNTQLVATALAQLDHTVHYSDYLKGVEDRADKITNVSIFARKDSFSYRSILKTPAAYQHLKGNLLQFGNSQTLIYATSREFTDIFAVLLLFLLTTILVLNEKEKGLFSLVRPTKKGRVPLLGVKLLAIFTYSIIIYLFLYTGNFLASYLLYGGIDLTYLLQSVEGFLGSTLELTIGSYLILFSVTKIFAYLFLALLFVLLCIGAKTGMFVYCISSSYTVASFLLYQMIPTDSYLSIFKYFNIVSMLHTNKLYENYLDINILGYPHNILTICIILLVFGNFILLLLNLYLFNKQKNLILHNSEVLQRILRHLPFQGSCSSKLWVYEGYKILITNKVLLVFTVVTLISFYSYKHYYMPYIPNDGIYKYYMLKASGKITTDTYAFLDKEQAYFDNLREQTVTIRKAYQLGYIDATTYSYMLSRLEPEFKKEIGFQMLLAKVEELKPYYKSTQKDKPWLVYDTGYNQLLGINKNNDLNIAYVLFLFSMIACIAPTYAAENLFGARYLLRPTMKGRFYSLFSRFKVLGILTIFLSIIVYLPPFINILKSYGYNGINSPIQSITDYRNFPFSISIRGFLILLYGMRLLFAELMMILILCISYHSKNITSALSVSFSIIVIPFILMLLGASFLSILLCNPFILVYPILMSDKDLTTKVLLIISSITCLGGIILLIQKTYRKIK